MEVFRGCLIASLISVPIWLLLASLYIWFMYL